MVLSFNNWFGIIGYYLHRLPESGGGEGQTESGGEGEGQTESGLLASDKKKIEWFLFGSPNLQFQSNSFIRASSVIYFPIHLVFLSLAL